MTKKFLHKHLHTESTNSLLGKEIELSEDLGKSVSISPSYLFYYSSDTGCQYFKLSQLTRIFAQIEFGRFSTSYLVFETKENHLVKIRGQMDFLRARIACDTLCPHVLIGEQGEEMTAKEIVVLYRKRKQALLILSFFILIWNILFYFCIQTEPLVGVIILAVTSIAGVLLAFLLIRFIGYNR